MGCKPLALLHHRFDEVVGAEGGGVQEDFEPLRIFETTDTIRPRVCVIMTAQNISRILYLYIVSNIMMGDIGKISFGNIKHIKTSFCSITTSIFRRI